MPRGGWFFNSNNLVFLLYRYYFSPYSRALVALCSYCTQCSVYYMVPTSQSQRRVTRYICIHTSQRGKKTRGVRLLFWQINNMCISIYIYIYMYRRTMQSNSWLVYTRRTDENPASTPAWPTTRAWTFSPERRFWCGECTITCLLGVGSST